MVERRLPLPARVSVLGGLYLVQGLVFGTGGLVLLPQLAAAGVDLQQQVGILSLAGVPWVIKLAWAPLLDTPLGRRLGMGRIAAVAMAAIAGGFVAIAAVPEPAGALLPIAVLWLVINAALSLQDVAADALAFDTLSPRERGRALAVMLGAHHLGAEVLAGTWIGAVVVARSLGAALVLLAIVVLALASLALALPRGSPPPRSPLGPAVRALVRDRTGLWALGVCGLVFAADVATSAVFTELIVDRLGWSQLDIAARVPLPAAVGWLGGYVCAFFVIDRVGHLRTARWGSVALGGCWAGFALVESAWSEPTFMQAFILVQCFVSAALYAGVHAMIMDVVQPELRATQLAVLHATLNLPRVWAPLLAASVVAGAGLAGLFVACGLWQIAVAWPLARLSRPSRDGPTHDPVQGG